MSSPEHSSPAPVAPRFRTSLFFEIIGPLLWQRTLLTSHPIRKTLTSFFSGAVFFFFLPSDPTSCCGGPLFAALFLPHDKLAAVSGPERLTIVSFLRVRHGAPPSSPSSRKPKTCRQELEVSPLGSLRGRGCTPWHFFLLPRALDADARKYFFVRGDIRRLRCPFLFPGFRKFFLSILSLFLLLVCFPSFLLRSLRSCEPVTMPFYEDEDIPASFFFSRLGLPPPP